MKRFATNNDIFDLKQIYNTCFPNEQDYCNKFFGNVFKPENTIVVELNGKVVSMLQILPISLTNGVCEYSCYYIYAAATLPEFEGKGIMSDLINYSFLLNSEKDYAVLITQNSSLFDFYKKFGFYKAFFVNNKPVYPINHGIEPRRCNNLAQINNLATENLNGTVFNKRTEKVLSLNLKCSGGTVYTYRNSYCVLETENGFSRITEALGEHCLLLCEQVLYNCGINKATALLPFGKTPFGMAKPLKNSNRITGYINLLFN